MAFLIDDLVLWIGKKVKDMAEEELYGDKDKVHEELVALQVKLDMGEIDEKTYEMKEDEILERLEEIRRREEEKEE